jgi:hypothetical protein
VGGTTAGMDAPMKGKHSSPLLGSKKKKEKRFGRETFCLPGFSRYRSAFMFTSVTIMKIKAVQFFETSGSACRTKQCQSQKKRFQCSFFFLSCRHKARSRPRTLHCSLQKVLTLLYECRPIRNTPLLLTLNEILCSKTVNETFSNTRQVLTNNFTFPCRS